MKSFKLKKSDGSSPPTVYSISDDSPLNEIQKIEQELTEYGYKGKVFFDLFMSNTVRSGRYIEAHFNGFTFDYSSFHLLENITMSIKKESLRFYMTEPGLLETVLLPGFYKSQEGVAI